MRMPWATAEVGISLRSRGLSAHGFARIRQFVGKKNLHLSATPIFEYEDMNVTIYPFVQFTRALMFTPYTLGSVARSNPFLPNPTPLSHRIALVFLENTGSKRCCLV